MRTDKDNVLKVGIVQHSFLSDVETNRTRNVSAIANLAAEGAKLIVLSELHDSLYFCQTENVDNFDLASELVYPTAIGWNPDDTADEKERQRMAWITIQRSHAVANGLPVVSVNRCGFEEDPSEQTSGIDFWGSSFVAGPQGELLYEAPEDRPDEACVEIDLERSENVRRWWPFLRDRRIDAYADILRRFRN